MADDEQLAEGFDVGDRFGELIAAHSIHVGGRFIEKGDVDVCQDLEQCQPNRESRAHLFATG